MTMKLAVIVTNVPANWQWSKRAKSTIQIKNSTTSGNSPSSLATGELAINVVDGNFFYGSGSAVSLNISGDIGEDLNSAGLWDSFRERPFDRVPNINSKPNYIFVNCFNFFVLF